MTTDNQESRFLREQSQTCASDSIPAPTDWRQLSIVEIASENASVSDYVVHWEGRCLKAEAKVERLTEALTRSKTTFFYIRNLSHQAWRDSANLEAVCRRIENHAIMEYDLLEAALLNHQTARPGNGAEGSDETGTGVVYWRRIWVSGSRVTRDQWAEGSDERARRNIERAVPEAC